MEVEGAQGGGFQPRTLAGLFSLVRVKRKSKRSAGPAVWPWRQFNVVRGQETPLEREPKGEALWNQG